MNAAPLHKTVLVTGAGRGLGRVIAETLAKDGFRVAVSDIDSARATATAQAISAAGGQALAMALDVREKADFEQALAEIINRWGSVGVLVNNAALTRTTPLFEISPEEFSEITDVNLRGTFMGCQVFGHHFGEQRYGRIVNLASLAGQNGGAATGAHYAASKGGIVTLTKVFARDLAAKGVTVNAIAPGPLDVDLVREILPADKLTAMVGTIPVGTLGDPAFIGDTVKLLASPNAGSVTGATFDINGGLYVR